MKSIRVLIADDHDMVRRGIRTWLEAETDIVVIDDISNGTQVIKKVVEHEPDVLLLDLNFPDIHGISIIHTLRERGNTTPVLVLTGYEKQSAKAVLEAGANGFLNKEDSRGAIIEAVRWAANGGEGKWLSPSVAKEILKMDSAVSHAGLTKTEIKILSLIDKSNSDIAKTLFLSEGTVKNHISNIYNKIDVSTRLEALAWVKKIGILKTED